MKIKLLLPIVMLVCSGFARAGSENADIEPGVEERMRGIITEIHGLLAVMEQKDVNPGKTYELMQFGEIVASTNNRESAVVAAKARAIETRCPVFILERVLSIEVDKTGNVIEQKPVIVAAGR